jgi:hypothetical protein
MKVLLIVSFIWTLLFIPIRLPYGGDAINLAADRAGESSYSSSCQTDLDTDGDVDGMELHLFAEDFDYLYSQEDVSIFEENYGKMFSPQLVNALRNPGSVLVFPLIDNIHFKTIVDITNRAREDVWLQCYMVVQPLGEQYSFTTNGFFVHLTHSEPFYWSTSTPYHRVDKDGVLTEIQSFDQKRGYLFCFAVEDQTTGMEKNWNHLIGSSHLYHNTQAWQYNAIPHQAINIVPDRILHLNGVEYTMATSQIMFEGFAENFVQGLGGELSVCNLNNDYNKLLESENSVYLECWNQNEVPGGRHLNFSRFEQYDLGSDLYLRFEDVFTPKFQCASMSSAPIWAVFHQFAGDLVWGGNVWQHPLTGSPATIVLAPAPLSKLTDSPDHDE